MTDQQTPANDRAKTIQTRGCGTMVGLRTLGWAFTEHLPPDAPLELYEMTAAVRSRPEHKLDLLKVAIHSGLTGQLMNMPVPYPHVFSGSPMRETVIYRMDDPVQFAFKNEFSTDEVTVDLCCSVRRPPIQQVERQRSSPYWLTSGEIIIYPHAVLEYVLLMPRGLVGEFSSVFVSMLRLGEPLDTLEDAAIFLCMGMYPGWRLARQRTDLPQPLVLGGGERGQLVRIESRNELPATVVVTLSGVARRS